MVKLVNKSLLKFEKIPKLHLTFMNFKVKNFTKRNDAKRKKALIFECYNLVGPME
jgi:hypothetical protein